MPGSATAFLRRSPIEPGAHLPGGLEARAVGRAGVRDDERERGEGRLDVGLRLTEHEH